ncbi:hypothetical protein KEM54_002544 [Ascosphaera aggregata]|nr:hypothetical protein KEM54_002544 [Ascosphaera aggregata]
MSFAGPSVCMGPKAHSGSMTPPSTSDGEKNNAAYLQSTGFRPAHIDSSSQSTSDAAAPETTTTTTTITATTTCDIRPDHYYKDGGVPVFKPTMEQFRDFSRFIRAVDHYGMQSGIIKVIPPKEWTDSLQPLDEAVKSIRIKKPNRQEFLKAHGAHGAYTQAIFEKQKTYDLPAWKAECSRSQYQPPARRGETRRNNDRGTRPTRPRNHSNHNHSHNQNQDQTSPAKSKKFTNASAREGCFVTVPQPQQCNKADGPPTPVSPDSGPIIVKTEDLSDSESLSVAEPRRHRQNENAGSKRKYNDADDYDDNDDDEEDGNNDNDDDNDDENSSERFNYKLEYAHEYTQERCDELEVAYWKSLFYSNPMYGADMPGSLFHESTPCWNVANLPNILNALGQNIPGVNTSYLYLGMWKATFAWHLEDVDLYSINYIHFGAPKQWYSISQRDASRFEAAMRSIWPDDAKKCDQFLRHKTYLISPSRLKNEFGIEVNKLVHFEGEFVITYPYGYHSGYNLGYNCAESVNFATEQWLNYGRVAKKCNCESDSVWIDVDEIERRLRGEPTPEPEPSSINYDSDASNAPSDLLTPPRSIQEQVHRSGSKSVKRRKLNQQNPRSRRSKSCATPSRSSPCVLCPNDFDFEQLLPTHDGLAQAHRTCARYIEETNVLADAAGNEFVCHIDNICKARLGLKCLHCREAQGACIQCTHGKCTRAYHPTCALLAGVQAEVGEVPVLAEDGKEYSVPAVNLKCKYHRQKRSASMAPNSQDADAQFQIASGLQQGDLVQFQPDREIYGAQVLENRYAERSLLLRVLPNNESVEIPYTYLSVVKKSNFSPLPADIKPLPAHLARRLDNEKEVKLSVPVSGSRFADTNPAHHWAEFSSIDTARHFPLKVDLFQPEQIWHYLGQSSTECKARYTDNPRKPYHNPRSHFLGYVRSQAETSAATATNTTEAASSPSSPQQPAKQCAQTQGQPGPSQPSVKKSYDDVSVLHFHAPDYQKDRGTVSGLQRHEQPPYIKQEPDESPKHLSDSIAPFQDSPWGEDGSKRMQEAHQLFASIVDHANQRAGHAIADPDFAAKCLLASLDAPVPEHGIEKLVSALCESSVAIQTSEGQAQSASLKIDSQEVNELLRMLRFAVINFVRDAKELASPRDGLHSRKSSRSDSRSVKTVRYAYLEIQEQNRPTIYQSPYGPGSGFSAYAKEEYNLIEKPNPTPKKQSAADFFQSLSVEDQEKILRACGKEMVQKQAPVQSNMIPCLPADEHPVTPRFDRESTPDEFSGQHMSTPFDLSFRADSPASSFGRPPLLEYSHIPDPDFSALPRIPRHIHDQHDIFSDNHAMHRFWQRTWDGDLPDHRVLSPSPHERPNNFSPLTAPLDIVRGPGSLNAMEMAGFSFDDDGLCVMPMSP